ncbi:hypothetical protein D1632_07775 [Chryseobacterium nematophagum]|uniref:Uncharacterized protein n=1 Tax=Chryseobacterium nematophagum TaxID=2305228 RepID=A0A3M7L9U3_9FLAO|nr:hypothetical protein [Chryseobacterium nematophagum]RMZ59523.1 hypothetical protein D1632_07775 [Chryseobacterium nematophagum]
MFTFEYVAGHGGSTEENSALFETEVRLREGVKIFTVAGNQVYTINNYMYNTRGAFRANTHKMDILNNSGRVLLWKFSFKNRQCCIILFFFTRIYFKCLL